MQKWVRVAPEWGEGPPEWRYFGRKDPQGAWRAILGEICRNLGAESDEDGPKWIPVESGWASWPWNVKGCE